MLSLVVLAVAFAAQPVEATWNPHAQPAPTLPSPGGGGKNARSAPSRSVPAPRVVDVRTIAKRPPTPTLPRKGGGRLLPQLPRQAGGKYSASYASTSGPHAV